MSEREQWDYYKDCPDCRAVMEAMATAMRDDSFVHCDACPHNSKTCGGVCDEYTPADILAHFEGKAKGERT